MKTVNKQNDGKMTAVMALLAIIAAGSVWAWYVQDPTYSEVGVLFLTYLFVPGMVVTFLVCRLPQLFRAILIAIVVIPAFISAGVILTQNKEYSSYAWGYLAFLGSILIISFGAWNNQQKTENSEYGFRLVSILVLACVSFFIGVSAGTEWGIAFFIGIPFTIFVFARIQKNRANRRGNS